MLQLEYAASKTDTLKLCGQWDGIKRNENISEIPKPDKDIRRKLQINM